MVLPLTSAFAAQTSAKGGASLQYRYNDNVRVTPTNRIAISGWNPSAFGEVAFETDRFKSGAKLTLSSEQYDNVATKELSPGLTGPEASDFNSDDQKLQTNLSYLWEKHYLSLETEYSRDSTLNTQFLDTGLGELPEIEGAIRTTNLSITPGWTWTLTERQQIQTTIGWREVEYDSARYTNYDYGSLNIVWSYSLSERFSLQLSPQYSVYQSKTPRSLVPLGPFQTLETGPLTSTTIGLQAGVVWDYSEKINLNILLGATEVDTEREGGIYGSFAGFLFNFEPFEDQRNNGFTGNLSASYTEERYGASANFYSRFSPSADGGLRENSEAQFSYYWKPRERIRLDLEMIYGQSDSSDNSDRSNRVFTEVGVRFGYQFAREWWVGTHYRFRQQEYDNSQDGAGEGNLVAISLSYRLPKEIL